jgi:hypothetical protein
MYPTLPNSTRLSKSSPRISMPATTLCMPRCNSTMLAWTN